MSSGGEKFDLERFRTLLNELAKLGFTTTQKREVWEAAQADPDGLERCLERARVVGKREGRPIAGLILTMIRSGEHQLVPDPLARRITGWRWVYGAGHAAGTYVQDPEGTDPLPPGYDLVTRNPVVERAEREKAEQP